MGFLFQKHYTLEEARALLPQVKKWFQELDHHRERFATLDKRVAGKLASGEDIGGDSVNEWVKTLAAIKQILQRFHSRQIQIKDMERGLIDFPAIREGREIFLCWERDEEDIEHWHDLESGYSGREPL